MSALVSSMLRASVAHEPPSKAAAEIAGRVLALGELPNPITFPALVQILALAAELGMQHGSDIVRTFAQRGDFAASMAAHARLIGAGFSVGPMQRGAPRGILFAPGRVALVGKWRNMTAADRQRGVLHGEMVGDRYGPVTVTIYAEAPPEARAAFIAAERSGGAR